MNAVKPSAAQLIDSCLPGRSASARDLVFLTPRASASENQLISFNSRGERLVLKVFSNSFSYSLTTLLRPFPRYVSRSYRLRYPSKTRVENELRCIAAFQEAGFRTFEIVDRPTPKSLLFRYMPGENLRTRLRACDSETRLGYVRRLATDLRERQEWVLENQNRWAIHPEPKLKHVHLTPEDEFVYLDFESRVNPSLPLGTALAIETEYFIGALASFKPTAEIRCIEAAVEALGEEVMARYRSCRPTWVWLLSYSSRKRRRLLSDFEVLGHGSN